MGQRFMSMICRALYKLEYKGGKVIEYKGGNINKLNNKFTYS